MSSVWTGSALASLRAGAERDARARSAEVAGSASAGGVGGAKAPVGATAAAAGAASGRSSAGLLLPSRSSHDESNLFAVEYSFGELLEGCAADRGASKDSSSPLGGAAEAPGGQPLPTAGVITLRTLSDSGGRWGGSCGSSVWAASPALGNWLCAEGTWRSLVQGRAVLELGAGLGLAGMLCAKAGARRVRRAFEPVGLPAFVATWQHADAT